jgi:leucyl aminopeptidase
MQIEFSPLSIKPAPVHIVPVFADRRLDSAGLHPDTVADAERILTSPGTFEGKTSEVLTVPGTANGMLVLIGLGKPEALNALACETAGGRLAKALSDQKLARAELVLHLPADAALSSSQAAAHLAHGALLKSYKFDKYKTAKTGEGPFLSIRVADAAAAERAFAPMRESAAGAYFARDLANEPPNALYPETMLQRLIAELSPLGVKIRALSEDDMREKGMGALLAVAQGSAKKPYLVTMEWDGTGGRQKDLPIALVGKGVTFDTGGYSIKPAAGMDQMKFDMGGAAAVVGAIRSLAGRKAPVRIVGAVGLVENMISGNAYRPGDIVTSMAGKTIEINNTDAEGRLVLADVLTYVQREFKPAHIVDLATLTGACRVALGTAFAGVFSNDDDFAAAIMQAGAAVHERGWRMPLDDIFNRAMKDTPYADLVNAASIGGGASTAAEFIKEFIEPGVKWTHLDIAAMASGASGHPTLPDKIGNGFGVRLLDRLIADRFEEKAPAASPTPAPAP